MFEQTLSTDAKSNLAAVGQTVLAGKFYLAGGSAVALHLGHRFSFDLDFFCKEHFNIDEVLQTLKELGSLETYQASADTFNGKLNNLRISFFIYPYPVLEPFQMYSNIQIASLMDLAAMKIDAITRRGTKRDFVDLFFISQYTFPLEKAIELYFNKFHEFNISPVHVYKSLMYFDDAEPQEMPQMIAKSNWKEIKTFFLREGQALYRSRIAKA